MMAKQFNGKNLKTHLYTFENGEHLKPVSKMKKYLDLYNLLHMSLLVQKYVPHLWQLVGK